jgi:hypothetical protein
MNGFVELSASASGASFASVSCEFVLDGNIFGAPNSITNIPAGSTGQIVLATRLLANAGQHTVQVQCQATGVSTGLGSFTIVVTG